MKFSIITPSFNQGQFIQQTIDSVISQVGDFEIEYFVMDGGSTDNTVQILKATEIKLKNNSRIKFYWQSIKDKGQSDAINLAMTKISGDLVAYINSDDYYLPGTLQKVFKQYIPNKTIWIIGQCKIVDDKNREIQKLVKIYKNLWLKFYSYSTLLILNYVTQPSTFWSPKISKLSGKFDTKMHLAMDYNFWLSIGSKYNPLIINDELSAFRIHSKSKGQNNYIPQFQEDYLIASSHTKNKILLCLHSFHNALIIFVYKIIK